jgi:hypothetical protein
VIQLAVKSMGRELRNINGDELTTANREVVAVDNRSTVGDEVITSEGREVMAVDHRSRNQALVSYWALPLIFLTVTLLGGLRVSAEGQKFIFFPPPLITLVLAVLLMLLFVRGGLIDCDRG